MMMRRRSWRGGRGGHSCRHGSRRRSGRCVNEMPREPPPHGAVSVDLIRRAVVVAHDPVAGVHHTHFQRMGASCLRPQQWRDGHGGSCQHQSPPPGQPCSPDALPPPLAARSQTAESFPSPSGPTLAPGQRPPSLSDPPPRRHRPPPPGPLAPPQRESTAPRWQGQAVRCASPPPGPAPGAARSHQGAPAARAAGHYLAAANER